MGLLDSKLFKEIERTGKLPVIETSVAIPRRTVIDVAVAAFFVCVAVILVNKILRNV